MSQPSGTGASIAPRIPHLGTSETATSTPAPNFVNGEDKHMPNDEQSPESTSPTPTSTPTKRPRKRLPKRYALGVLLVVAVCYFAWRAALPMKVFNTYRASLPMKTVTVLIMVWFAYIKTQARFDHTVDRPVPRLGWQAKLYKVLRACKISYVPVRGIKELIDIEAKQHSELVAQLPGEQGIIYGAIGIASGSGKGTFVSNAGVVSAMATRLWTVLLDIRPKLGNIALRFGLDRRPNDADPNLLIKDSTTTVRQAMALFRRGFFTTWHRTKVLFPSVEYLKEWGINLSVLASDITPPGQVQEMYEVEQAGEVVDFCSANAPVALLEFDNEISRPIEWLLMDKVDVPVFITNWSKYTSDEELLAALVSYRTRPELDEKIRRNGILLVTDIKGKHDTNYFAEYFGFPAERIFFVDHHSYFTAPDRSQHALGQPVVYPKRMPLQAQLELLRALNTGLESEIQWRLEQLTPIAS